MLGIIKKDLMYFKVQMIVIGILSVVYIAAFLFINEIVFDGEIEGTGFTRGMMAVIPILFSLMFGTKNFEYSHSNVNGEKYFNSLPVTRVGMVVSEYIASVLFVLFGYILSIPCMYVFCKTDDISFGMGEFKVLTITAIVAIVCIAVQLPVLVYNGDMMMGLEVLLGIVSIPVIIAFVTMDVGLDINKMIEKIMKFYQDNEFIKENLLLLAVSFGATLSALGTVIATVVYKRREFR